MLADAGRGAGGPSSASSTRCAVAHASSVIAFGCPGSRVRGAKTMSAFANGTACVPSSTSCAALGPVRPRRADGIRVHGLGREPLQPGDDRVRRAVADAGRAERAVERAGHARDAVEHARSRADGSRSHGRPAWVRPCGSSRVLHRWRTARTPRRRRSHAQATPRPDARARPSARRTPRTSAVRGAGCAERIVTARPAAVPRCSRVPG